VITGVGIYLGLGVICLLVTIFGFKFPPRGSDAIIKAYIMIIGWIFICPLLWLELLEESKDMID
jgi:hypothetical protein